MVETVLVSYGAISAFATCGFLAWGWARGRREAVVREPGAQRLCAHSRQLKETLG